MGLHEGEGNCLKHLKRRWNRKDGRGNKDFKKGGASWVKGLVSFKGGGMEPTYEICNMNQESSSHTVQYTVATLSVD